MREQVVVGTDVSAVVVMIVAVVTTAFAMVVVITWHVYECGDPCDDSKSLAADHKLVMSLYIM